MLPGETEVLIRTYLDAFNRSDSEAMLALLCEDVIHDVNEGGRRDRPGEVPLVQRHDG